MATPETTELAWHFLRSVDGVPMLRDGVTPAPKVGDWLVHLGELKICESGLHASVRAIDALRYCSWNNAVACLVEIDSVLGEPGDKLVCRERRIVGMVACDEILRLFARQQALSVIDLWDAPAVAREYLETGNEEILDAAYYAAVSAAAASSSYAASAAVYAAAVYASSSYAASYAAPYAAYYAAVYASSSYAASYAASYADSAPNDMLESMLLAAMEIKGEDL